MPLNYVEFSVARAVKPFSDKLFDCCWVELDGYARPELCVQMRIKPPIFRIDDCLYDERGIPLPTHAEAARVIVIYNTTISPRRMVG